MEEINFRSSVFFEKMIRSNNIIIRSGYIKGVRQRLIIGFILAERERHRIKYRKIKMLTHKIRFSLRTFHLISNIYRKLVLKIAPLTWCSKLPRLCND